MNLRSRFTLVLSLFLITFFVYILIENPSKKSSYGDFGVPIPTAYPILGIDISHYQGNVNWEQLKQSKHGQDSIQFVFIKATEGLTLLDDQLLNNAEGATSQKLDFGCYHFFIPDISAKLQAKFFAKQLIQTEFTLKPVLDIEFDGDFSNERLIDSINVFLDEVEKKVKSRPIIYTYSNFYKEHFKDQLVDELIWIAKYGHSCELMNRENVIAWQFSEEGTVNGIEGFVDLNLAKNSFFEKMKKK